MAIGENEETSRLRSGRNSKETNAFFPKFRKEQKIHRTSSAKESSESPSEAAHSLDCVVAKKHEKAECHLDFEKFEIGSSTDSLYLIILPNYSCNLS